MFRWHGKFDWSDVDARYLQGFLMSSTGRKLALMVEDEVTASNERAALSRGCAWTGGCACGFKAMWGFIKDFSAQLEESPASNETADELEHLRP